MNRSGIKEVRKEDVAVQRDGREGRQAGETECVISREEETQHFEPDGIMRKAVSLIKAFSFYFLAFLIIG